jgi:hypothetical protein
VRGNTVSSETTFLNLSIVERPTRRKRTEEPKAEKPSKEAEEEQV